MQFLGAHEIDLGMPRESRERHDVENGLLQNVRQRHRGFSGRNLCKAFLSKRAYPVVGRRRKIEEHPELVNAYLMGPCRVADIEAIGIARGDPVWWIPASRDAGYDNEATHCDWNRLYSRARDTGFKAVAHQVFEALHLIIGIKPCERNDLGGSAACLVHSDNQVPSNCIREGGDVLKKFLYVRIIATVGRHLVVDGNAFGNARVHQRQQVGSEICSKSRRPRDNGIQASDFSYH